MASRAIIGKVDRQGNGQAIYLGHGFCPDDAGAMLRDNYSGEEPIDRIIRRGAIARLAAAPDQRGRCLRVAGHRRVPPLPAELALNVGTTVAYANLCKGCSRRDGEANGGCCARW